MQDDPDPDNTVKFDQNLSIATTRNRYYINNGNETRRLLGTMTRDGRKSQPIDLKPPYAVVGIFICRFDHKRQSWRGILYVETRWFDYCPRKRCIHIVPWLWSPFPHIHIHAPLPYRTNRNECHNVDNSCN